MSTIIRRVVGDASENHVRVSDAWDLRSQIEALEQWLKDHPRELDPSLEWIADVGFTHRQRSGIGGGPPLTRDLMRMCLDSNLEIYLSDYGVEQQ